MPSSELVFTTMEWLDINKKGNVIIPDHNTMHNNVSCQHESIGFRFNAMLNFIFVFLGFHLLMCEQCFCTREFGQTANPSLASLNISLIDNILNKYYNNILIY